MYFCFQAHYLKQILVLAFIFLSYYENWCIYIYSHTKYIFTSVVKIMYFKNMVVFDIRIGEAE